MKVGDLVQYNTPARYSYSGKIGTIVALRPLRDDCEYPYWAEVRYMDNIHQVTTCKASNLKVLSQ